MASADWKVELVDSSGEADYTVAVVGDQVVDLTGAAEGDVLTVNDDGLVVPQTPQSLVPQQVFRSAGDVTLAADTNWADTDPGGTAPSRPMDLVYAWPDGRDVEPGDWLLATPGWFSASSGGSFAQDIAVVDLSGAVVRRWAETMLGGATSGFTAWFIVASMHSFGGSPFSYQVQAGDVFGGVVRCRMQNKRGSPGAARTIAASVQNRWTLEGRGPFR